MLSSREVRRALEGLRYVGRDIALESERYEAALDECQDPDPWRVVRRRSSPSDPTATRAIAAARVRDESLAALRELRRVQQAGYAIARRCRAEGDLGPGSVAARAYELVYIEGVSWHAAQTRLSISHSSLGRALREFVQWLRRHPELVQDLRARPQSGRLRSEARQESMGKGEHDE